MDLLLKLLVGVAVGGVVGALGYGAYKIITSDSLKDDVIDDLREQDEDLLKKAFKARVKDKGNDEVTQDIFDQWSSDEDLLKKAFKAKVKDRGNDEVTLDIFDQWSSNPITQTTIHGDEVASDIYIGQVIYLKTNY